VCRVHSTFLVENGYIATVHLTRTNHCAFRHPCTSRSLTPTSCQQTRAEAAILAFSFLHTSRHPHTPLTTTTPTTPLLRYRPHQFRSSTPTLFWPIILSRIHPSYTASPHFLLCSALRARLLCHNIGCPLPRSHDYTSCTIQ
jgi:hypothetical protein